MSGVLLYKLSGRPTGREIARGLGLSFGTCFFFRKTPPTWVKIRWGGAELPELDRTTTLNKAEAIRVASSKIASFRRMAEVDVPIPRYTTSVREASQWRWDGATILGRTSQGFQGRGISVYEHGVEGGIGNHDLYTEYIPNEREYRLHVVRGVVVSIQRKYLERPNERRSAFIKNHGNGFAFKTPEKDLNQSRKDAAVKAVEALGLDFGAVDMIVDHDGKEYVLEVNTAPALSPKRVEQYLTALRPLLSAQ